MGMQLVEPFSRMDRLLFLYECGLNIPDYVENPYKKHRSSTRMFLKEVFRDCFYITLLAKRADQITELEGQTINSVLLSTSVLESDNFDVWLLEGIECEWSGSIWIYEDGSGCIKAKGSKSFSRKFTHYESTTDVVEKSILRRVYSFMKEAGYFGVHIDYGWAKTFGGKLNEKIVFFDFLPLEKSS